MVEIPENIPCEKGIRQALAEFFKENININYLKENIH